MLNGKCLRILVKQQTVRRCYNVKQYCSAFKFHTKFGSIKRLENSCKHTYNNDFTGGKILEIMLYCMASTYTDILSL